MSPEITNDWHGRWDPKAYLHQYYKTPDVPTDEIAIFNILIPYLKQRNPIFAQAIDVGSGATLHHEIPLIPYVEQMYVSDYLQSNLDEVSKWLRADADAHNWDIYIQGILKLEGKTPVSEADIHTRRELMKSRIAEPLLIDVAQTYPLGQERRFPLVTAFYVAESVAQTRDEWVRNMTNISSLVADDGVWIISAVRNTNSYQVGDAYFPTAHIDETDIAEILHQLGYPHPKIEVATVKEWHDEGFDSIVVAIAEKQKL